MLTDADQCSKCVEENFPSYHMQSSTHLIGKSLNHKREGSGLRLAEESCVFTKNFLRVELNVMVWESLCLCLSAIVCIKVWCKMVLCWQWESGLVLVGPQDSEGGRADLPASSVRSVWAGGEVTGVTPLSLSPNNLHLGLSSTAQHRTGLVWSG